MFEDWAVLYDSVYAAKGKDYAEESRYLLRWIGPPAAVRVSAAVADERARGESTSARRSLPSVAPDFPTGPIQPSTHLIPGHPEPDRPSILDVACGTGEHLFRFGRQFQLFGIDRSQEMLSVARKKLPSASLFLSDMTSYDLGRRFDAVTCLFSSIGYLPHVPALHRAIAKMADHLADDGVLLIEPPIPPTRLAPPETTTMRFLHESSEWERETSATVDGETLHIRFVYRPLGSAGAGGVGPAPEIVDEQSIRLFTDEEVAGAMERAGLEVEHDSRGPSGLGLYVGRRTEPWS